MVDLNYVLDAICQGPVTGEMVVEAREHVRRMDTENTRLRARVEELMAAVQPLVDLGDAWDLWGAGHEPDDTIIWHDGGLFYKHFTAAKAALAQTEEG